jgi:hypothetical protein
MNIQDAIKLLAIAAVYDNRTPSQAAAQAWAADLEGISLAEAAAAVREHYTTSPDAYLKAGHVIAVVKRRRRAESRGQWVQELRALRGVDPDDPYAVLEALRRVQQPTPGESQRLALPPGRFAAGPSQGERNARGVAAARAALGRVRSLEPQPRRDALAELAETVERMAGTPGEDCDAA